MKEITYEELDVAKIPPGGVLVRLPLFPEDYVVRDEFQPRTKFTKARMEKLKASLQSQGQKQYPSVRWMMVNSKLIFVLDDGERRTRSYRELGWKDALYIVLPEEYKPVYDPDRELGQAAANAGQERHTVGEIVRLTQRIVRTEIENRKKSGASQHGAVIVAINKVSQAFGEKPDWARPYHILGSLTDELLNMLDGDDEKEPELKWGDAISLATATPEEQIGILKRAKELFPNNPHARRTFISRTARSSRENRGEKVRGSASDDKERFLSYCKQLRGLGERASEGRSREENLTHMRKMLSGMRIFEIEQLLKDLQIGLAPFVPLYREGKAIRERKLEESDLKHVPEEVEGE